jgi:very-short-patch-repair endonuclease
MEGYMSPSDKQNQVNTGAPLVMGHKSELKRELARKFRQEMTNAESILWSRLRRNQLHGFHFRRQQIIDGFIADFYCHAARLVVEVDGGVHENFVEYDALRDSIIQSNGLRLVRFANARVTNNIEVVLDDIAKLISTT